MENNLDIELALKELELLEEEAKRRRRERGIDFFVPNRCQLEALRKKAPMVAFAAGNRSGKTVSGATQLASHITLRYPKCHCHGEWYVKERKFTRPIKGVVVATGYPVVERTLEPKIIEFLPKECIRRIKRTPQGFLRRIETTNGSVVDILTNEMDDMAFESSDWDFAWIDEPTQKKKFLAILRGLLDRGGKSFLSFTPLVEPWMKEMIIDREDGKEIDVVRANTYDNTLDIHANPILRPEDIRRFEGQLPREMVRTRIYGEFFHLKGLVYPNFSGAHVFDEASVVSYQWSRPVFCVLDPHDRKPHHVIWAFLDEKDWLYVDRELVMEGSLKDLAKEMLSVEAASGYRLVLRLVDPNFGRKPLLTTQRSVIDELASGDYPVFFTEACDDRAAGHLAVRERLHFNSREP